MLQGCLGTGLWRAAAAPQGDPCSAVGPGAPVFGHRRDDQPEHRPHGALHAACFSSSPTSRAGRSFPSPGHQDCECGCEAVWQYSRWRGCRAGDPEVTEWAAEGAAGKSRFRKAEMRLLTSCDKRGGRGWAPEERGCWPRTARCGVRPCGVDTEGPMPLLGPSSTWRRSRAPPLPSPVLVWARVRLLSGPLGFPGHSVSRWCLGRRRQIQMCWIWVTFA